MAEVKKTKITYEGLKKLETELEELKTVRRKDVAQKIKEAREQAGLNRSEMSRLFEIPLRTLEEWDAGRRTPPPYVEKLIIEKLERIAKEQ